MRTQVLIKLNRKWLKFRSIEAVKRELLSAIVRGDWSLRAVLVYREVDSRYRHIATLTPYISINGMVRVKTQLTGRYTH